MREISWRQEHKNIFFNLCRPLIHVCMILFLYAIGYYTRLISDGIPWRRLRIPSIDVSELTIFACISALLFLVIGVVKKWYTLTDIGITKNSSFLTVWMQWITIMICLAYFGQWFLFPYGISRLIIGWVAWATIVFIPFIDYIANYVGTRLLKYSREHILILYRDKDHYNNIRKHIRPEYYTISYMHYDENYTAKELKNFHTIILVGSYDKDMIQSIFEQVRLHNQQLYHIADNHFLEDVSYETSRIGNMLALRYRATELEWWATIIKRLFDTTLSLIWLIFLLPLFIIIGIAIKIDSPWPIFYKQLRIGRNMKAFTFIKFRSMYTHLSVGSSYGGQEAEKLYKQLIDSDANVRKGELAKIQNDPRVTRIGKFLRATSLDELPSLLCVLMGTMSLVWPRPHMPSEIEKYKSRHKRVLSVKPGITGYAQIHGRDTLSFDEEAEKELLYLQNWSIFLDLYILFGTFRVLFVGKNK